LARRNGISDEVLETLHTPDTCPVPESDRAALHFAESMTLRAGSVTLETIDGLRSHFDEEQIVELACVIGLFNYLNRFAEALGMWPTRPGEGGPEDASLPEGA
jgi:alkylhydroperoxidase family enzyme